jgi:hypothetical protein
MTTKYHRRTPSNDGTIETVFSSPSRSSSGNSSSNNTMDTTTNNNNEHITIEKDIEIATSLPIRGRSMNHNETISILSNNDSSNNNNSKGESSSTTSSVKISGSAWKSIMACLNYSCCSVSMILVNKSLASRYVFFVDFLQKLSFYANHGI